MESQTWIGLVKKHWPGITDEDADMLLWEATCFPMGKPETVEAQLISARIASNGDVQLAMDQAADYIRDAILCGNP